MVLRMVLITTTSTIIFYYFWCLDLDTVVVFDSFVVLSYIRALAVDLGSHFHSSFSFYWVERFDSIRIESNRISIVWIVAPLSFDSLRTSWTRAVVGVLISEIFRILTTRVLYVHLVPYECFNNVLARLLKNLLLISASILLQHHQTSTPDFIFSFPHTHSSTFNDFVVSRQLP